MSLYTHTPTVKYLKAWCAEHMGAHDDPLYHKYHSLFADHLAKKRTEQQQLHDNEGKFGMSQAAGCIRANSLRRAGVKGKPPDGDTRLTWEIGHLLECMSLAVLEAPGFTLSASQVRCELPNHLSWADGILAAGPVDLPYPLLLSIKTNSYKSSGRTKGGFKRFGFAGLPLDGIRTSQPSWYVQAQLEMLAKIVPRALILVVAKDMVKAFEGDEIFQESGSLSWYAELIEFDTVIAEEVAHAYRPGRDLTRPAVYSPDKGFITLPAPGDVSEGWGGLNKEATGTFNPCFGCEFGGMPEVCHG